MNNNVGIVFIKIASLTCAFSVSLPNLILSKIRLRWGILLQLFHPIAESVHGPGRIVELGLVHGNPELLQRLVGEDPAVPSNLGEVATSR